MVSLMAPLLAQHSTAPLPGVLLPTQLCSPRGHKCWQKRLSPRRAVAALLQDVGSFFLALGVLKPDVNGF